MKTQLLKQGNLYNWRGDLGDLKVTYLGHTRETVKRQTWYVFQHYRDCKVSGIYKDDVEVEITDF